MNLFNIKISMNTLLFDGHFIQKNESIIQKNQKIQPRTLNLKSHPFKISLFSFWGYAGEMVI